VSFGLFPANITVSQYKVLQQLGGPPEKRSNVTRHPSAHHKESHNIATAGTAAHAPVFIIEEDEAAPLVFFRDLHGGKQRGEAGEKGSALSGGE
jgi:hypothetical protein